MQLSTQQVAFSQPTSEGAKLAAKFFGTDDFAVYVEGAVLAGTAPPETCLNQRAV